MAGKSWTNEITCGDQFCVNEFRDQATDESREPVDSKISKLWMQRLKVRKVKFSCDRRMDVPTENAAVLAIVDFLCAGLAELVYGE